MEDTNIRIVNFLISIIFCIISVMNFIIGVLFRNFFTIPIALVSIIVLIINMIIYFVVRGKNRIIKRIKNWIRKKKRKIDYVRLLEKSSIRYYCNRFKDMKNIIECSSCEHFLSDNCDLE